MCVCEGRAGEGGVRSSSKAIKFGAVHSCLTPDLPRALPYLTELIAQVHKATIGPQVSDTIGSERETNKHCLVSGKLLLPPPNPCEERGTKRVDFVSEECVIMCK